jgi:hypothetical protein
VKKGSGAFRLCLSTRGEASSLLVDPPSTMGMLDEDEALMLQKLQEIREKKAIALEESHNRLRAEVTTLQNVIAQLQTENQ